MLHSIRLAAIASEQHRKLHDTSRKMKLQAALPSEPSSDVGSVTVTVKDLPELESVVSRSTVWRNILALSLRPVERAMTRRFRPNETLSDVFNWIDASGTVDFNTFLFKLDNPKISIK
jgi:hypothetical protein